MLPLFVLQICNKLCSEIVTVPCAYWFREILCHNNQCADFSKFDRLWPTRVMGNVAVIKTVCITRDMSPVALQLIVAGRLCWDEEQTSLSMKF